MTCLLLAPHHDDEVLWASFLILRYRPHVVVAFASVKQEQHGVTNTQRLSETVEACGLLGAAGVTQWSVTDTTPDETARTMLKSRIEKLSGEFSHVFAPAVEENGHEQHTLVGELAVEVFGTNNVTQYLTYMRGSTRSTSEWDVPFEPLWPAYKLAAMSCYHSQIRIANTLPWFIDGTLREYLAHPPKPIDEVEQVGVFLDRHAHEWTADDALRSVL